MHAACDVFSLCCCFLAFRNLGAGSRRAEVPGSGPRCFHPPGPAFLPSLGMPRVPPLHPGLFSCHLWVAQGDFAAPWAALPPSRDSPGCCRHTLGWISCPLRLAQGVPTAPWAPLFSAAILLTCDQMAPPHQLLPPRLPAPAPTHAHACFITAPAPNQLDHPCYCASLRLRSTKPLTMCLLPFLPLSSAVFLR
jgi:hypothetical protein